MKKIAHILIVFIFGISTLGANAINECKSDLYYANGIMMKYSEKDARDMWQDEADNLLSSYQEYKSIEKIDISYNSSQGFLDDLLEALEQMMDNEWGWTEFTAFFTVYLTDHNIQEDWVPHIKDLQKQVASYTESIKNGHGVIVVAHSQGNYYTNEAYERLDTWMQPYFHMMGVATPANHVAGYPAGDSTAPYVKFHNDFINVIVSSLPANRNDTRHHGFPSIDAHDFYESYLKEPTTGSDIQQFIIKQTQEHLKAPSQWQTDQEIERGTCNYRITVKHRFDPSIEIGETVYPFAPNKKLYQVNGEYVKATCGGTYFTNEWDGKKENECWMINNPPKEKITAGCYITSFFDKDDEGWTIVGDAQNGNRKPDYKGGYIQATDDELGDLWYFQAPPKFSGDLSLCYGSTFSFDLRQSNTTNQVFAEDIIINSTYGQITYRFGYTPGINWTSFTTEMTETGWNTNLNTNLTEAEFKKILSSITSIAIRGEYRNGFDIGSLDNVIMGQAQ